MALGNRPRTVVRLVLLENLFLGTVGAIAGVTFGAIVAVAISAVGIPMPPPPNSEVGYRAAIQVVPAVVLTGLVVGIVSPLLAAIIPGRRLMRLEVGAALRHNV
jgi:putative ABC transport system permease protein